MQPTPPLLKTILLANGLDFPERDGGPLRWLNLETETGTDPERETAFAALAAANEGRCEFHTMPVAAAAKSALPEFDVIVAADLWSRSPDRGIIPEILKKSLKPGGAFCLDYDAQPGLADVMPLREIALSLIPERGLAAALKTMESLADSNESMYFAMNRQSAELLKRLAAAPDAAATAKYFDPGWQPFYFRDVAAALAAAGCRFVGSTMPERELGAAVPQKLADLVNQVPDPVVRQTVLDFAAKRTFRRDVFVRDPQPVPHAEWIERLRETGLILRENREKISLDREWENGRVSLLPELFNPLLDALAKDGRTAKPAATVLAPLLAAGGDAPGATECLKALVGLGLAFPANLPEKITADAETSCARLNAEICRRFLESGGGPNALASPVIGGMAPFSPDEMLLVATRPAQPDAEADVETWAHAAAVKWLRNRPGTPFRSATDEMKRAVAAFRAKREADLSAYRIRVDAGEKS